MTQIRLPELTGGTEAEQLRRIQSYLYTLAEQLQTAFDSIGETPAVPAPAAAAAAKQEKQENFAAIKSLILRSAQITEQISEKVEKKLSGKYVAQSQFGSFTQLTEQKISATSQELRQEFGSWQQIESDVEEIRSSLLEVNASIRTGLLAETEDGAGVYGVEIGQQEREDGVIRFRKYARLTAQKLSFYDNNDVEVAYISDRRLHVTGASVQSISTESAAIRSLQMGDYTWQAGADGHLSLR